MNTNKISLFVRAFNPGMDEQTRTDLINQLFSNYINLEAGDVILIPNREYGGFKNFCFVKVPADQAQKLVDELNGQELADGTELVVNIAKPKEDKPRSFGDRDGGRGGFGGNKSGGFSRGRDNNGGGSRY
jgi:hypothetical protein